MGARDWVVGIEQAWDRVRLHRAGDRTPDDFRIEAYGGHGGAAEGVVVRGRALDDPVPTEAVAGEGVRASTRRTLRHFVTDELPGVPVRVSVAGATVEATTDAEGYFLVRLRPDRSALTAPLTTGTVELADSYRGLTEPHTTTFDVFVPPDGARFGVISDVDDTILETGVQRVARMVKQTVTGSALTRTSFAGCPRAVPRPGRRREPVLLRLVEPVEPLPVPPRVPAPPGLPAWPDPAARPARHLGRP